MKTVETTRDDNGEFTLSTRVDGGPTEFEVCVYVDGSQVLPDCLNIVSDKYEGHAFMSIEALPELIKALQTLEAERKAGE